MSEQLYKITITLTAEDLTRKDGKDRGSSAVIMNNEVSAEARHMIEASLSQTMVGWGDDAVKSGR